MSDLRFGPVQPTPQEIHDAGEQLVRRVFGDPAAQPPSDRPHWLGAPEFFRLNAACLQINEAFDGFGTYLVGSSLERRDFRDVDVRTIIDDAHFARLFGRAEPGPYLNGFWSLLCASVSFYLKDLTGLPIDWQVQSQSHANAEYPHKRNAIGIFIRRDAPVTTGEGGKRG